MVNKVSEIVVKLKELYKISVANDYLEVQEGILETIVSLTNLVQENCMGNAKNSNKISYENITYTLIHLDKNKNEFYIYPRREDDFKRQVYEEGSLFVRAFHPDGKVEDCVRKVNRIWQSSVLWNINSMFSDFIKDGRGEKLHFSKGKNLKVYACPVSFKDSIPKKI